MSKYRWLNQPTLNESFLFSFSNKIMNNTICYFHLQLSYTCIAYDEGQNVTMRSGWLWKSLPPAAFKATMPFSVYRFCYSNNKLLDNDVQPLPPIHTYLLQPLINKGFDAILWTITLHRWYIVEPQWICRLIIAFEHIFFMFDYCLIMMTILLIWNNHTT